LRIEAINLVDITVSLDAQIWGMQFV